MKTFLLGLTAATALALCLAGCGGSGSSRRSSGYNSSYAGTSSNTRSTTSNTTGTTSNTRASSSGNAAGSASSSYNTGGGSATSSSSGYTSSEDSARQRRYAAYQDWKARWNRAIQLGQQVAVSGNNELFNQWLALQKSLVDEFNQNRYAEFDSPPSGSGGYSGGSSGGYSGSASRGTRACGTCRGTGVLDTCAFRNAYEPGFDPSSCRKTCPSCGGRGHVQY